jgi:hypothetical protein
MRGLISALCLSLWALPLWADARMSVLVDVLKLAEVANILVQEDQAYAQELNEDMLDGKGGAAWQLQVDAILNEARMVEQVRGALEARLEGKLLEDAIAFYASDLGTRIIQFENTGRLAFSDPDIEDAARDRYLELQDGSDPRLMAIRRLVDGGDMIDLNITGTLSANYQFRRGMADGGVLNMSDDEILADVAAQTDQVSEDTSIWLFSFMLLAYSPLSDAELESYIAFSATPAGQALNTALFDGFGASYEDISYGLGRAIALNMGAQEL